MHQPSLDDLLLKVDSKYTLVVAVAKRARIIMTESIGEKENGIKPVSIALDEIADGNISFECVQEGIK